MAMHNNATHLLFRMWCLAGEEAPKDGKLAGYSASTFEATLGWRGRKGKLVALLIEAGFLEKSENGYQVLNWDQDQGHIWKNKQKAKSAIRARWEDTPSNTPRITRSNATSTA